MGRFCPHENDYKLTIPKQTNITTFNALGNLLLNGENENPLGFVDSTPAAAVGRISEKWSNPGVSKTSCQ
jgi:hypothetical protein